MSCGESLVSSVTQTISLRLASGNEARLRGLFSTLPLAGVALPTARSGYSRNLLTITMSALRVNCGANSLFGQLLFTKFSSTRRSRNLQRRPRATSPLCAVPEPYRLPLFPLCFLQQELFCFRQECRRGTKSNTPCRIAKATHRTESRLLPNESGVSDRAKLTMLGFSHDFIRRSHARSSLCLLCCHHWIRPWKCACKPRSNLLFWYQRRPHRDAD